MILLAYSGALVLLALITIWATDSAVQDRKAVATPAEHKKMAKVYAFRAESYRLQSEQQQQSARQAQSTATSGSKPTEEERKFSQFTSAHYQNRAAKMQRLAAQHGHSAHSATGTKSRKVPGPRLVTSR